MKNFSKINFIKAGMAIALFLSLAYSGVVYGQTLVPSSSANPDTTWFSPVACPSTPGYIQGINTAMIDFLDAGPNFTYGLGTLAVCDYYGNATSGGVAFTDINSGYTVQIDYCNTGGYMAGRPDIIVGNDITRPGRDYRVAAAYINSSDLPQIDYYLVHYIYPGFFTVSFLGSTTFSSSYAPSITVHLDMIADFGNTTATGLPWCDTFVVTWDANITTGTPKLWTAMLTLSASPGTAIPYSLPPAVTIGAGTFPDVAGIQRTVGACATCPSNIDNIGLYTYTDATQGNLYYVEYDFTLGSLSTVVRLKGPVTNYTIDVPRIDAPDDFNINSPSILFLSYYKVVADVSGVSMTFDNIIGYGGTLDAGYMGSGSDVPYSPTVAFGSNNSTQYVVSHYENEYGSGTPNVFMEPINWMSPHIIPDYSPYPYLYQDYFQINQTAISYISGGYNNSISTPCNLPSDKTLNAWVWGATSTVYYKTSDYGSLPNGFTYRHANTNAVVPVVNQVWQVYPNPATSNLNVSNPGDAGSYEITDMLGRILLSGNLPNGLKNIDISALPYGSYIINNYFENSESKHSSFVKE